MNPLISIIIPVYNTEKHLSKCLDSAINQTLKNIEIIVVNDCSPDNSEEIIKSYIQKDTRITYLKHDINKGLLQTRRDGLVVAKGEYILALDSDDWLDLDACAEIAKTIQQHAPDIIQISLKVLTEDSISYANLLFDKLEGSECFEELFVNNVYVSWNMGGKVTKRSLLELVYQEIPNNIYLINAEDFLQYYTAIFLAKSFIGCPKAIYNYNCIEVSVSNSVLKNRDLCLLWLDALKLLFEIINTFKAKYNIDQLYPEIKNEKYNDYWIIRLFFSKIPLKNQKEFFPVFCEKIGWERVCNILVQYYPLEIIAKVLPEYQLKENKLVKNIAFICVKIHDGGIERVIALLANLLVDKGYNITIITKEPKNQNDYYLSPKVIRKELTVQRYSNLKNIIKEQNIDTVILSDYWSNETCYDLYYLNTQDVNVINCLHSVPIWGYFHLSMREDLYFTKFFNLADVMTCLSHKDKIYLENQQELPIVYMPNPLTFDPLSIKSNSLEDLNIVYIGRLSSEKNPLFLLNAFKIVLETIPKAKLYIVGEGSLEEEVIARIQQLSIQDSVIVTGYTSDIQQYYQLASIHVLPSLYEGQPMTWLEAKAYGIPSVVSRIDSVELTYHKGVIIIDQGDVSGFAEALIKLLSDKECRVKLGQEAKESLEYFKTEKTLEKWLQLFNDLSTNTLTKSPLLALDKEYNTKEVLRIYKNLKIENLSQDAGVYPMSETIADQRPLSNKQKIKKIIKKIISSIFNIILPKNSRRYNKVKQLVKIIITAIRD